MQHSHHAVDLARQLRGLREHAFGVTVTQRKLAEALSQEQPIGAPTLSTWENTSDPTLPPAVRLRAVARFFASQRSLTPAPHLLADEELDDEERAELARLERELLRLREAAAAPPEPDRRRPRPRLWRFDDEGPLTIICPDVPDDDLPPLSDPSAPNYTDLLNYADLDALIELHGHIRAENPAMPVFFRRASRMIPDDLSGHVVLIGGVGWNEATRQILEDLELPVVQVPRDPKLPTGDPFELTIGDETERLYPSWSTTEPRELVQDIALVARLVNPYNGRRTLTLCNGIHSRGVLGAVRSFTDARMREANESWLDGRFADATEFGIVARVKVLKGRALTPDLTKAKSLVHTWPEQAEVAA